MQSSTQWVILGVVIALGAGAVAFLGREGIIGVSYGAESLLSAIATGGLIILAIGIIKAIILKIKKGRNTQEPPQGLSQ